MNNCTDPNWRAFKIIEGLRGKAMEYFDTLPVEVGKDVELLCKEMFSRFDENEPGLSLRYKLYQVDKKGGIHGRYMAVRAFPSLGRARVELYAVEFFLKGLGNKRTSLAVLFKAPASIEKVVLFFIGRIFIYRKIQQQNLAYIMMYNIYNLPSSNTCLWIEVFQLI